MSTTIQTLCAKAVERLGVTPGEATLARILSFACSLDERAASLDLLDQVELENAAVEYATAWIAAEHLETAVGETGPFALRYAKDSLETSCRVNPALSHAAAARTRMRQILKAIKALLKGAQREAEAQRTVEPRQTAPMTNEELQTSADTLSEPSAKEHPPVATSALTPVEPIAVAGESGREGEVPDEPRQANPEPQPAPEPPVAPPMNRAQRRAQARLEAKQRRRARKHRGKARAR